MGAIMFGEHQRMVQLEEQPDPALREEIKARLNLACTEHQAMDHIYFGAHPLYYKSQEHWLLSEDRAYVKDRDRAMARVVVRLSSSLKCLLTSSPDIHCA